MENHQIGRIFSLSLSENTYQKNLPREVHFEYFVHYTKNNANFSFTISIKNMAFVHYIVNFCYIAIHYIKVWVYFENSTWPNIIYV